MSMSFSSALAQPARKNEIVQDLEGRILRGDWSPGQHLPSERELCLVYGVSRPVIREVLAGLVERGFIDIHAGRGSFIRAVEVDDLSSPLTRAATRVGITARDLVAARVALECAAVGVAARREDPPIIRLREALDVHERAESLGDVARTDLDFHDALVAASGNPVLMLMFGAIRVQVLALMLRSHSDKAVHEAGDPLHRAIVDAIAARDPETARDLMQHHLELALELYGTDLDLPISEVVRARGLPDSIPTPRSEPRRASLGSDPSSEEDSRR